MFRKIILLGLLVSALPTPNVSATSNNSGVSKGNLSAGVFFVIGIAGYFIYRWSDLFNSQLNNKPFSEAASSGKLVLGQNFITADAGVNAKDDAGRTPLHLAEREDNLARVKELIKHKADVNATDKDGWTPLHCAADSGHFKIVKYLVEHGADVNVKGVFGRTLLHSAADRGHFKIVKYLVEHGADVNVKGVCGRTLLRQAVLGGHLEIVKYLVGQKADVNAKDDDGWTPLHWAVIKGHLEIVKYLVEHKADVNAKDNCGQTPLHLAARTGHLEIKEYLTLAEDFYQIVNNTMTVQTFFKTHEFTQQVLNDVFGLAIMTGSYETLKKLYDFDPSTFSATIKGLTKIDFTASPAKSLSWYVQLLGIAIASSSAKLFHKIITISHAIDGLQSIIYGILLPRVKLDKPSNTELVTQIKELRNAWVAASKEKEKEAFIKNSTRLLKTEFALKQKTYQENTFENKKPIKTEVTPIPNYVAPRVLSFLSTSDFVKTKK